MFQAMSFVKGKRSVVYPNPGFQRQLMDYEKKLISSRKAHLDILNTMPGQSKLSGVYTSNSTALKSRASTTTATRIVTKRKPEQGYKNKTAQKKEYKDLKEAFGDY